MNARRGQKTLWRRDLGLIFVLALAPRLLCAVALPVRPTWDGVIYLRAAEQLARGEGYTQRALRADAPARASAYYPVGFPATLAVVRVAGGGARTDLILQSLFGALTACATYLLARRYGARRRARTAALLIAFWPTGILLSATWMSEALFTCALCFALLPLAWAKLRHAALGFAFTCIGLGICAYVRPIALIIAGTLAVALVARDVRRRWHFALIALVCTAAPLLPWTLRNARVLDAPALVSTNGGTNLLLGTVGDGRFTRIPAAIDCPDGLREVERDRCRSDHALTRIRAKPLAFVARAAMKLGDTFAYESATALELGVSLAPRGAPIPHWALALAALSSIYYILLLAAAVYAAWMSRTTIPASLRVLVLGPVVATAALHAVSLGGDRYHLPLVPLFAAIAVFALRAGRSSSV